jgi:glucosamine-6-phosphate deaminase
MRLIITKNVGLWAANYIREKIAKHDDKDNFVLGLPTGGTAVLMYKNLVDFYIKKKISFKNVTTFNMDEYVGLPKDHPQSYWYFMQENLFKLVDINVNNTNIPNGNAKDIKKECLDYEAKIHAVGGIDLFVGGVGENGHIAFNEPYSSLASKTRDKELNKSTIAANARFFENNLDLVPKTAITVGIDTLLQAKEVMILISGEKKALALQQCLEGPVSHLWPISVLQFHKKAIIVADEAACCELKVKTYKYFSELEDEYSYIDKL